MFQIAPLKLLLCCGFPVGFAINQSSSFFNIFQFGACNLATLGWIAIDQIPDNRPNDSDYTSYNKQASPAQEMLDGNKKGSQKGQTDELDGCIHANGRCPFLIGKPAGNDLVVRWEGGSFKGACRHTQPEQGSKSLDELLGQCCQRPGE